MTLRSRRGLTRRLASRRGLARVGMALTALWVVACSDSTGPMPIPNLAPLANGSISPRTVAAGETVTVNVSGLFTDPDGDALTFTATSSNAATASVAVSGSVVTVEATARGVATVTVTAGTLDGLSASISFNVTVRNQAPVARDTVPAQTLFIGDTASVNLAAYFSDPDGDALSYSVASSDSTAVSASISGSLLSLEALVRGVSTLTVTARDPEELSAQQHVTVTVANREPVAIDSIPPQTPFVDQTVELDLSSYFADLDGDALSYAAGSSNGAVVLAVVSGGGFGMIAVSAGSAIVTVTANDPGGLCAHLTFEVTVEAQAPVVISGVEPSVLIEGASATITGSGFSDDAIENEIMIGEFAARVTSASATRLSITVPWSDCLPPRREELRVTVGSKSDARTVGVTPRSQEDMELKQGWYRSTYAGYGCVYLPADVSGGEYLIGVVSTSEDAASLTGVTLTGTPGDATVVAADGGRIVVAAEGGVGDETGRSAMTALAQGPFRSADAFTRRRALPIAASSLGTIPAEWPLADDTLRMRQARARNEIMARSQALLRRLGRATPPALADARRDLQVGDTLTLFADSDVTCSSAGQVRAVVRLIGNSSIWLDDLDNPVATFTDAELANLDDFYSVNAKGVHDDYFGGLSDVDRNGRFLVLMTKEVNRLNNVNGWVWSGDLFSSAQCPTSNRAEIFYGKVPDPQGLAGDTVTKQALLNRYPSLMAHEVTHLVQNNARIVGSAGLKTMWEKEGGATLAEQLVGYRLFGHGSGQELDRGALAPREERRHWYGWLFELAQFFGWDSRGDGAGKISGAPEECSWVGTPDEGNSGPCQLGGRAVYGVPSMVLRYALDRWGGDYPGGERALMRRLTQSPAQGFASLVDVSPESAWPPEQVLADFYITLWIDLQGSPGALGMTTWDLHDIFSNLRPNTRLQPYTSSSHTPRLTGRRVRAGSSLYFHWTPTGSLGPTAIKVTSASGGRVPDHISVWALRTR